MKIKINGEEKTFEQDTLTVAELLVVNEVKMPEMVSVEFNGEILERDNFGTTSVEDGNEIEFLYFMGGGQ